MNAIYSQQGPWVSLMPPALNAGHMNALEAGIINANTAMLASANGVTGNGTTDDAAALNTLLSSAAAFGAEVVLDAGSTVLISSVTVTVPSGTRLNLNGATIKSALPGTGDRLLTITGKTNVHIHSGTLDGNTAGWAGGTTEQRHNVFISNSSNITLRKVLSKNAHGDGIYVGDQTGASTDIYLERVISDGNWRNGISISHVSGFTAVGCKFRNSIGTNPQAGADVEPNVGTVACEDIHFIGCDFKGNQHFGFVASLQYGSTARQGGIDLVGCTISGNGLANDTFGGGANLREAMDVTFVGGSVSNNTGPGFLIDHNSASERVTLKGVTVRLNSTHGFSLTRAAVSLTIESCLFKDNGTATATTYDGINLSPAAATSSVRLLGNISTGTGQRNGLLTTSTVSNLVSIGNDYTGNGTASTSLGDDQATRTQLDGAGSWFTTRQFFYSAAAATISSYRLVGDSNDRLSVLTDGRVIWGPGNASGDAQLSRVAAGVVGTGAAQAFRPGVAVTASRPSAATVGKGSMFYDSTLSKPIWSDGTNWKDATGTTV